jgi:Fimbrial assembly protein (PilN)
MSRTCRLGLIALMAMTMTSAWAQGASGPAPVASTQSVERAMRALTPSGVNLGNVSKEGDLFVLNGTSASNQQLSDFMRKAVAAPGARNVELRRVERDTNQYRYEISLKVSCAAGGAADAGAICGPAPKAKAVYKCRVNGTVTFQAAPCPPGTEIQ